MIYKMFLEKKKQESIGKFFFFNFTSGNAVRCEAAFVGHNPIFCGTMSNDVRC